ncbi:methyl-accepting chemotaxis protein [Paenibacillus phyllosphaerae]|uniref:Methyl-accepting chemotaxis protein n=1 Tax=Paenibacillus phyllosphaerae TaxID=274593 RepID=A0A7W5AU94_9BACL|nr:methyl-accepting chemotaxis protein [Paenibacillus phyllosphaerae]MBB3108889.1 methyl-accepting chemotaxis protein [Paenibacillus phyllosphaerae]
MKFSVGTKLQGGFIAVAALVGVIGSLAYVNLGDVDTSYSDLTDRRSVILSNAKDLQINASQEISGLRGILLEEDDSNEVLATAMTELDTAIASMLKLVDDDKHVQTLNELSSKNKSFKEAAEQTLALYATNEESAKQHAMNVAIPIAREIRTMADSLAEDQLTLMLDGSKEKTVYVNELKKTLAILSLSAIALAIIIGWLITRSITKPVMAIRHESQKMASGDLTGDAIRIHAQDEIGELTVSFNQMKSNLKTLIGQVTGNANQVGITSDELAASAEQTSHATEQISGSIQEIALGAEQQVSRAAESAEAVTEITRGMAQAAESIMHVANLTQSTNAKAKQGSSVAKQAVDQMNLVQHSVSQTADVVHSLGDKSNEIGEIVQIITEISSQTNLLALNAAIEAARAGEQGRGFAVVADEVRKLAEESGQAASQIRTLIEAIQQSTKQAVLSMNEGTSVVRSGIDMVRMTGDAFAEIVQAVEEVAAESQEVSAIVEQVSASSKGVATMISSVTRTAEESAGSTENVAASAEEQNASMQEIAASAEDLSRLAQELQDTVRVFKL